MGGASGGIALRRAARAVQAGDADFVACVAADTNHVDSFRKTLSSFSRFAQDAVYPYGSGGPNASFALITRHYMNRTGATREDFGRICVAQRANAQRYDGALMRKPLTLDDYLDARPIADPIHLFDCVMPCAGAEAFLVMPRGRRAARWACPSCRVLSHDRAPQRLPGRSDPDPRRLGDWTATISGRRRASPPATSTSCRPTTTTR